jgi:hemin uptake protein HemP
MNPRGGQDDEGIRKHSDPSVAAGGRHVAVADHRIDSRELFVDTREITITHRGEIYRLRLTAQNKLILTK